MNSEKLQKSEVVTVMACYLTTQEDGNHFEMKVIINKILLLLANAIYVIKVKVFI